MRGPLHRAPWVFFTRWYFKCFCFLGWVDNFRLMWLENSVKYLKPFSPQPTQFPENPAGEATKGRSTGVRFKAYIQSGPKKMPELFSRTAFCKLHSYLGWLEHTDLKVHFSHSRQARSGGPRHTPGCARGRRGTWLRPARSLLGLRWALLPWRPGGGLYQPDRNLRWGIARCNVSFYSDEHEGATISDLHV